MRASLVSIILLFLAVHRCEGTSCSGGVRYPHLGCFNRLPPFDNTGWLPQRPSLVNTYFTLFTRGMPAEGQRLNPFNRRNISRSNFNASLPTKVLIHGFLQHGQMDFVVNITEALLETAPMNVIVVSWEGGAGFPYTKAVANTRLVGAQTARLLRALRQFKGASMVNVHLIGHSLGAHIAGYAGARTSGLGRITGLDPAQPNYSGYPNAVRLDPSDAYFVDVIHTDARQYDTTGGYGMIEPVGHVDFYPNGGRDQPGCPPEASLIGLMEDFVYNGLTDAERAISCSHERSTTLFLASILQSRNRSRHDQCLFKAVPCSTYSSFLRGDCLSCGFRGCPVMGIDASRSGARGVHFLNTTAAPGFCGFNYFVNVWISEASMEDVTGRVSVKLVGDSSSTEWADVHNGDIEPGTTISSLVLSASDIGDLQEVKVQASYDEGTFSWTSSEITIAKVKVGSIRDFLPRYYCETGMTLTEGQVLTLTSGNYEESACEDYRLIRMEAVA